MKIEQLRQEIESFESEIQKLQQELMAVGGRTLELSLAESDAGTISKSVRLAAAQVVERQPVLKGLKDAIAELTSRLAQKQSELQELEKQELKSERLRRIEEGKSRLRAKFNDVEKMAQSLQNLYFDLKAIAAQYEKDFVHIHLPTSGGAALNRNSLLNVEPLTIPYFVEEGDRFVLSNKFIDIFQEEKRLIEQQRLQESRSYRQDQERQWAEIKQKEAEEKLRIEQQERAALLVTKRSELVEWQAARTERLSSLANANVTYFDDGIAKLKEEIENLEKPMQG